MWYNRGITFTLEAFMGELGFFHILMLSIILLPFVIVVATIWKKLNLIKSMKPIFTWYAIGFLCFGIFVGIVSEIEHRKSMETISPVSEPQRQPQSEKSGFELI